MFSDLCLNRSKYIRCIHLKKKLEYFWRNRYIEQWKKIHFFNNKPIDISICHLLHLVFLIYINLCQRHHLAHPTQLLNNTNAHFFFWYVYHLVRRLIARHRTKIHQLAKCVIALNLISIVNFWFVYIVCWCLILTILSPNDSRELIIDGGAKCVFIFFKRTFIWF